MRKVLLSALAFALFMSFHAIADDEGVRLRYQTIQNQVFFVEHSVEYTRMFRRRPNAERETLISQRRESALAIFGVRPLYRRGTAPVPSDLEQISVASDDGPSRQFRLLILPPEMRPDSRGWTPVLRGRPDGTGNWAISELLQIFELFPILPDDPVRIGAEWDSEFVLPTFRGQSIVVSVSVRQRFTKYMEINGRNHAVITYRMAGEVDTRNHPEMLNTERKKQIKPFVRFIGTGTAHLCVESGIVVNRDQETFFTHRWTGELSESLVRQNPQWHLDIDNRISVRTSVRRITEDEAEALRAAKAARPEPEPPIPPEPVPFVPKWEYLVVRRRSVQPDIRQERETSVDRFLVQFGLRPGAGFRGQDEKDSKVSAIGPDLKAVEPEKPHYLWVPKAERLDFSKELPEGRGESQEFPMPLHVLLGFFHILPSPPPGELREGSEWSRELYVYASLWQPRHSIPIQVNHKAVGFEEKQGRNCIVVKFDFSNRLDVSLPPRDDLRGTVALNGEGTAYYDPEDKVFVSKEQRISRLSVSEILEKDEQGELVWRVFDKSLFDISFALTLRPLHEIE